MSERLPDHSKIDTIRKYANGEIKEKEFRIAMGLERTTSTNYTNAIERFKKYGSKPKRQAICKEFFAWADEWEKEHPNEEHATKQNQKKKIKYKFELIVWEYT